MATGQTLYGDISSLVNDIQEGSLFVLRQMNVIANTVTVFRNDGSMNPRKGYDWGQGNVRQVNDGDDITPTKFDHTLRQTLTPASYRDMFFISDQREASEWEAIRTAASQEMGSAFASNVDVNLASNFGSLTGGTVGTAGSALTWNNIFDAKAILHAAGVPEPYYCVLHTYQYLDLVKEALTGGNGGWQAAPGFTDNLITRYQVNSLIGGVVFATTANVEVDGTDATGAMYGRLALAYDERKSFNVRPERDESREGTELNASLWYAHGVWDATRGVQVVSDATAPGS